MKSRREQIESMALILRAKSKKKGREGREDGGTVGRWERCTNGVHAVLLDLALQVIPQETARQTRRSNWCYSTD